MSLFIRKHTINISCNVVIEGSVLTAVGLLLMFAALAQIQTIIEAANNGKSIKLSKGDFEVEVSAEKE